MSYYLLLWLATIVGQLFFATAAVWFWQRNNSKIDYFKALRVYFHKEVGTYVFVFTSTVLLTFILSDWMDLSKTKSDLIAKGELTRFEYWQLRFRTAATIWGVFAHLIAAVFFKAGKVAIQNYGTSKGVDIKSISDDSQ